MTPAAMQERRRDPNNQAVVILIHDLKEQVKELKIAVDELKKSNANVHIYSTEAIEGAVRSAMDVAFPEGDAESHRKSHEVHIKMAEERALLYRTLRTEVAKWGLLGLAAWAGLALWHAFLQGPK